MAGSGVTCDGTSTVVTSITWESKSLSGPLNAAIGTLVNLTSLYFLLSNNPNRILYTNSLNGSVPDSIGNLVNLVTLYAYSNQFTGSIPSSIGNATKLTYLYTLSTENSYLYSNQLTGSIPDSIGNLVNLVYLYFAFSIKILDGLVTINSMDQSLLLLEIALNYIHCIFYFLR